MKNLFLVILVAGLSSFTFPVTENTSTTYNSPKTQSGSFSILNDTKEAVSIHTGSGFVTLQKGSKTSVSCNVGKEVRHGESGKKGDLIFKIEDKHCGTTVKLSEYL